MKRLGFFLLALLLMAAPAAAQGTVMPVAHQVFLTNAGAPLVNGKICTYVAGSVSTPQATYSDEALTVELPNPIRTNSAGRMQNASGTETNVYWLQASYKVVVLTAGSTDDCSTGTQIYSADNIPAIPSSAAATDVDGIAGETITAGDAVYLSTSDGKWYRADADATASSTTAGKVGIAPSNIASGAEGSIRLEGRITGLSALSAGAKYYISATTGGITTTPPTNARFIAQADSTTSIVVGGNPGSVVLPDSNGTHSLVIKTTDNLTADRLLTVVGGDAAQTLTLNRPQIPGGRCTLTTAVPVTTSDVTAATTLYYTPYSAAPNPNQVSLYDGSAAWQTFTLTELSIAVPATTSQMYDVFVYSNSGTLTLELTAWTNDTTRATALTTQNGAYVKTGATTRLYVCSFRTTGVSGQTEDSFAKRYVWNYYNRVLRPLRVVEATDTWTYDNAAYRQANANAANQLDLVVGVAEVLLYAQVTGLVSSDTANEFQAVAIGEDSATTSLTTVVGRGFSSQVANLIFQVSAFLVRYPAVGRHYYVWLESSETATATWRGDVPATLSQAGIYGWIEG